jgi:serine protease inhibitor
LRWLGRTRGGPPIEETEQQSHFEMKVDRPFMAVIGHQSIGTILFMGWIGNPH